MFFFVFFKTFMFMTLCHTLDGYLISFLKTGSRITNATPSPLAGVMY